MLEINDKNISEVDKDAKKHVPEIFNRQIKIYKKMRRI